MNKELAIKIFREAAKIVAEHEKTFSCIAVEVASKNDFEIYSKLNALLSLLFNMSNNDAFYSFDAEGNQDFDFYSGTEKGKLGRAIMLDLMAEMIEMGDVEI